MPEDTNDIAPVEVEVPAPEEVSATTEAPEPEPQVEGAEVAPVEPEEITSARSGDVSMSSDGGSVQETEFRIQ